MDIIQLVELEVVLLARNEDRPMSLDEALEEVADRLHVVPGQVVACVRDEVLDYLHRPCLYEEATVPVSEPF